MNREGDLVSAEAISEGWIRQTVNNVAISLLTTLEVADFIFLFVKKKLTIRAMSASLLTMFQQLNKLQVLQDDIIFEATIAFSKVLKERMYIL